MKFVSIIIGFLLFVNGGVNAYAQLDEAHLRATAILVDAQKAVYGSVERKKITSLYVASVNNVFTKSESTFEMNPLPYQNEKRQVAEEELSIVFDSKIRQKMRSTDSEKNPNENFSKSEIIINGDSLLSENEVVVDGKKLDMDAIFNSPFMSESMKKEIKAAQEKVKPTKESLKRSIFAELFPIFLDLEWLNGKIFIYIGKAEAGDKRADILEIETDKDRQTRYFFDEETHHLLMTTDEISKNGNSSKTTIYYDNYELFDGLLVAKKVNIETESLIANMEMEIMGKKVKISSKSKMIFERTIKEFKINPTFKLDTFAIKQSKKS